MNCINLHRIPLALIVAATALLAIPAASHAAAVQREILDNPSPTNLVSITPIRIEADVEPGRPSVERVTIFNDSDSEVKLVTSIVDLGPPTDPTLLAEPVLDGYEFGASDWITTDIGNTTLQPFERIKFDVQIVPPLDAPVGASYAGVNFQFEGTRKEGTSTVALKFATMLQVLLQVPGAEVRDLKLTEAAARDMFHFGGTSFVTYGVRYRNDGNVSDHVDGDVVITSLFGNQVKKIDLGERALIRGATGSDRAVWSDPPMFGIFSAEAQIKGDDGKIQSKSMGRVVLLPPWWILALLAATLLLPPVYLWWKRRQEWKLYLEEEEEFDEGDEYASF
ncbi:MAG: hypothetical protein JWM86_1933 [Thermoleophilia bacterium]|nr:hypothetical protein [Thermoleophilia bacterium]